MFAEQSFFAVTSWSHYPLEVRKKVLGNEDILHLKIFQHLHRSGTNLFNEAN